MAQDYRIVQWTPFKKAFDVFLCAGVIVFIGAYVGASLLLAPQAGQLTPVQMLIRAFGACAFALLTLILSIGPLARLWPRALPLLYNRRHLGVTCFALALAHAALSVIWYHGFSHTNPLVSLLASNPRYDAIHGFPFESLGVGALLVLFLMAATSHDFWNATLGPGVWKALHMSVYAAFVLLVGHIMLGAVQGQKSPVYAIVVGVGAALVALLHIVTGQREADRDRPGAVADGGWLAVGAAVDIEDRCARIVSPVDGEKIAVFRSGNEIFAVSNVCRHQGGPLGEGRIVDGCITCPWHGFQYRPEDGRSPAPYNERIATYRTKIERGHVFVDPRPRPLGEATPASVIGARATT